jgi:hypothetical protein
MARDTVPFMADTSYAFTWIVPPNLPQTLADQFDPEAPEQMTRLDRFVNFCTSSRNYSLEYNVRKLIAQFEGLGLEYFRTFEAIEQASFPTFAALLVGDGLAAAIAGLSHLLTEVRRNPDQCVAGWTNQETYDQPGDVSAVLAQHWPLDLAGSFEWVAQGEDRERFADALAFLHAHRLCLEQAQAEQRAVLYAVCFW